MPAARKQSKAKRAAPSANAPPAAANPRALHDNAATSMRMNLWLMLLLACLASPQPAAADALERIKELRRSGCDSRPGVKAPLRRTRALDAVAQEWSRGGRLGDAFKRVDYRMVSSASIRIRGAADERALARLLAQNYCETILNASFSEIGVYDGDGQTWVVLAQPFEPPAARDAEKVRREVLQRVNAARAKPRKCGRKSFEPAPPLTLAPLLNRAAQAHADDMAAHDLFEHRGSDGSAPADRVTRTGYQWRTVGENIAAGARDAQSVVQGWLDSPAHCTNIMGPQYSQMGLAYAVDAQSEAGIYWAQVLATPR